MTNSFTQTLSIELGKLFLPLKQLDNEASVQAFFKELGWEIPISASELTTIVNKLVSANLIGKVTELADLLGQIAAIDDEADLLPLIKEVIALVKEIKEIVDEVLPLIKPVIEGVQNLVGDITTIGPELPRRFTDYLVFKYLEAYYYQAFAFGHVLGLFEWVPDSNSFPVKTVRWNRIGLLFSKPGQIFEDVYDWGLASFKGDDFLQRFEFILRAFMLPGGIYIQNDQLNDLLNPADPGTSLRKGSGKEIRMPLYQQGVWPASYVETGINLSPVYSGTDMPGLFLYPYLYGGVEINDDLSADWSIELTANVDLEAGVGLEIRPPVKFEVKTNLFSTPGVSDLKLELRIKNKQTGSTGTTYLIGSPSGSHVSVESAEFYLFAEKKAGDTDFGAEFKLEKLALVVKKGDGDGFINKIIPANGFTAALDFGLGYSLQKGFYFSEGAALKLTIPIHKKIGPLTLEDVVLELEPEDTGIDLGVATTFELALGPLWARVEEIGLKAELAFGEGSSPELDVSFKPPTGIALSIDAQGFSGGGYLYIGENRYAGVLHISFKNSINITAVGILVTKMPGGQDGFSLLIMITVEGFQPIQLGMGFTLNGVGGLLGLHRSINLDAMRDGVRNGAIDRILFPEDPLKNVELLISDLEAFFPVQQDQFVFGPMAIIGYGGPKALVEVELGLIIEVFHPFRLAILGVLSSILPNKEKPILTLKVAFVGAFDPEKKSITFDASIYDSRLLGFTLGGDMAFRLIYGNQPNFILTAGGFHPAYQPPPLQLNNLRRMSLSLLDEEDARVLLECYFAVTSNTVQVGAHLDVWFSAAGFDVIGYCGFDALFQFKPFHFVIEMSAGFAVRRNEKDLLSVDVALLLEGPAPWHVAGKATFKALGLEVSLNFDKSFGDAISEPLEDVLLIPLFMAELAKDRNWLTTFPANKYDLISIRQPAATEGLVFNPAGTLTVRQQLLPLNTVIQKFGNARPADAIFFDILSVQIQSGTSGKQTITFSGQVEDMFSPAQLFDLSDAEKLARPSFESYKSGISIGGPSDLKTGPAVVKEPSWELILIDGPDRTPLDRTALTQERFNHFLPNSAVGTSGLSPRDKAQHLPGLQKISIQKEQFSIAHASDLSPYVGTVTYPEEEARIVLAGIIQQHPHLEEELQMVPQYAMPADSVQ